MKLINVLFAEEMMPDQTGRMVIHAPFSNINVPFLPTTYSFSISLTFIDLSNIPNEIKVKLVSVDQEEIFNIAMPMSMPPEEKHIPIESRGITIGFGLKNLIFRKQGIYKLIVTWDDKSENYDLGVFELPN